MSNLGKPSFGPEIAVADTELPYGLFRQRNVAGYRLANGAVLLESERDERGFYKGGAGMDGMYMQTGELYAPVFSDDGEIRAFKSLRAESCLGNAAEQRDSMSGGQTSSRTEDGGEPPSIRDALRQFQAEQKAENGSDRRQERRR